MIRNISNKKLFLVWAASILLYLFYVMASDVSFNILMISGLTNICLLPLIIRKNGPLQIDNPIEYIKFNKGNLLMGDLKIPISKIKKVAIDYVGEDAYFSLPYNHISPIGVPNFVFPVGQITSLKSYLNENIKGVEFVT